MSSPEDLPVQGTFRYLQNHSDADQPEIRGAVHAVRRVPGGTAVYFSLGVRAGRDLEGSQFQEPPGLSGGYGIGDVDQVRLLDLQHLKAYLPLVGRGCLCSTVKDFDRAGGVLSVGYAVYAALPADVTTVTVKVGYGLAEDVEVEDGPLLPTSGARPLRVGEGWPDLPAPDVIASVTDPSRFVLPLVRHTADVRRVVTVNEQPARVDEDLSADVLFKVGSATLTPAARATLQQVAGRIRARAEGSVSIVGHTDATASDASNQALSEARAGSVRDALTPLVGGAVTLRASGRGEKDPVADNGTAEGRQANRRVTVTYRTSASS